jgi:hypothetical protein
VCGVCGVCGGVGVWGCGGLGGVGCCRVGSLLTFDIPQTALVATLDTYDFNDLYYFVLGATALPGSAGCFKKATQTPNAGHRLSSEKWSYDSKIGQQNLFSSEQMP